MKHTFRKSLALLLTVAMLLGMFTGVVAVQTTTASAADAETVEVVAGDEFWKALDEATASKKPTVIKLLGNISATDTVSDKTLYPHLQYQGNYVKCIVPSTCQIDLNGKTLTVRAVQTAAQLLPKADSFVDATGKGAIKLWMWNGVPVTITNAFASANRSKLVTSLQITVAINQKNLDIVVPAGVTLTGTAGVTGSKSLTFKSGAICGTTIVRGTNGVIFECATTEDFLRANIDKGTIIRLVADVRAADIVIGKNQTLDLNGHTLKCSTLTMNGKLVEKGGKVITGADPYDLTPNVEAPANDPVEKPVEIPADAKTYYVVDYIQSDGRDDYIATGIVPTQYLRVDIDAEMANLVEGAIFGANYTQSGNIESSEKGDTYYYSLRQNADGTYAFRYRLYTSWKFSTTGLEYSGNENTKTATAGTAYSFPSVTRAFFRTNYWLTGVRVTSEMTPYGTTASQQVDSKTAVSGITTKFGEHNIDLYLFANHNYNIADGTDEANFFAPSRIYSMKVYSSGGKGSYTLAASFLPVINEDGDAGLLNMMTGEFYGNKGTGNFKTGTILGELAVGGNNKNVFVYSSGAAQKVLAAADGVGSKIVTNAGNPEKPVLLSTQYPELADTSRWSYKAMRAAVLNGLIKGDSKGKLNLTGNLTRAEAATIITRAFGATESADVSSFKDVVSGQWYIAPMSRAVYMGVINGADGKLLPNSPITREQVFTILARALELPAYSAEFLADFSDAASVSDWAKESVAAMVVNGYVNGSDGKLNPKAYITREQFAQVMANIFQTYIQSGELYVGADGNVIINTAGAELRDVEAKLIVVGDGAASGDVTLDNVTVDTLVIRGGGLNTVHLKKTAAKTVIVAKPDGDIRVKSDSASDVATINVTVDGINGQPPKGIVLLETSTQLMNVASAATVRVQNATVQQLNAALGAKIEKGENANIVKSTTYVEPAAVEPEKPEDTTASGGAGGGGGGGGGGASSSTTEKTCQNGHAFIESTTPTKLPTCTEKGYYTDYCQTCHTSTIRYISALGHDYTDAESVLIEENGKMLVVQYCTRGCGEYDHEHAREATADEIFSVEADKSELLIGGKALITVKNGEGDVIPATFASTEGVAVDTDGVVTALAGGEAIATVTVSGLNQTVTFNVLKPAVKGDAEHVFTEIGEYFYFDMDNMPEPGYITWTSSDESVVTVDAEGKAVAVKNGKAMITAVGLEYAVTVDAPLVAENLSDLVTYLNLPASDGFDTTVKMAATMTLNGCITVPSGKKLDLNGNDLFVTGYVNEGTIVKNGGKLWAQVSKIATLTAKPTTADLTNFWAANEDLVRSNTDLDAIELLADMKTIDHACTAAQKSTILPNMVNAGAVVNNASLAYATAKIPEGKTLDMNGHLFIMRAASKSFGDGEIIDGGTIELQFYGINNSVPNLANAIALATGKHGALVTKFNQTATELDFTGYPIPAGVALTQTGGTRNGEIVLECATAEDLTRVGTEYATTLRLVNDIDAPDQSYAVPFGVTFDCNGYTLTCKAFSGPDEATFKTGNGGKVETESGIYSPAERAAELLPTVAVVNVGKTTQIELLYAKESATWTSSDETVATVDQTGLVTGLKAGTVTITATYKDAPLTATVTVNPSNAVEVATEQELINALLDRNAYITMTADITMTSPITLTEGQTLSLGTSTLKVSKLTVEAGATLNIEGGAVDGIIDYKTPTISATEITLEAEDETYELSVSHSAGMTLVWSSDNEAVATVDQNGVVTAVANGTANITVTVDGEEQTCVVTVAIPDPIFTESTLTLLEVGEEHTLVLLNAGSKTFTWSSDNEAVATVDQNGKVKAKANGTANISAAWGTGETEKTTCAVTVSIVTVTDVADKTQLEAALASSTYIRLTADIEADAVTIAEGKTLYLNGHNLYVTGFVNNGEPVVKNSGKIWASASKAATIASSADLADLSNIYAANEALFVPETELDGVRLADSIGEAGKKIVADAASRTLLPNFNAAGGFTTNTGLQYATFLIPAGKTLDLNGKTFTMYAGSNYNDADGTSANSATMGEGDVVANGGSIVLLYYSTSGSAPSLRNAWMLSKERAGIISAFTQTSSTVEYTNYPIPAGVTLTKSSGTITGTVTVMLGSEADFTRTGVELANKLKLANDVDAPTMSFAVPSGVTFDCNKHVLTCAAFSCAAENYKENDGYVLVGGEVFDPNATPAPTPSGTEVADKAALDAALTASAEEIKLTADINYNAALTVPTGTTIDFNGHNLYVTGLTNNGTLTKNGGKLWALAGANTQLSAAPTTADVSNYWAAQEELLRAETEFDGIKLTAFLSSANSAAGGLANTQAFVPLFYATGAYKVSTANNGLYFLGQIPAGKTLDLNGKSLMFCAVTDSMGEGAIIDTAGTAGRIRLFVNDSGNRGTYENAIAIANSRPTEKVFRILHAAGTVDYAGKEPVPTNAFFAVSGGSASNITMLVADQSDLTREGYTITGATLKLANDLTLTADVDVGAANVDLNGHTVTGGTIITTGEIFDSTLAPDPELSETSKTLTSAGEQFTLTLSNATATGWTSDHTEVATVAGGVVTAVANGTATITVEFAGGSLTCEVTVAIPPALSETAKTLTTAGEQFTLTLSNATATGWASDHPEFATVADGVVTAVANGTAIITVTYEGGSLTCTVTVAIPETPPTEVADKAALDAAFTAGDKGVKLTADINYADVLTIPADTTLYLDGHNLYVTGLTNNGTLNKNEGKLWANVSTIATLAAKPTEADVTNLYAAQEILWASENFDGVRLTADISEAGVKAVADAASRESYMPSFTAAGGFTTNTGVQYTTFTVPSGKTLDLNGHTFKMYAGSNYNDAGGSSSNSATMGEGSVVANGGSIALLYYGTSGSAPSLRGAWQLSKERAGIISAFTQTSSTVEYTSYPIPAGVTLTKTSGTITGTVTVMLGSEADFTRAGVELANKLKLANDIDAPTMSFAVPSGVTFDCNKHVLTCAAFSCAAADYQTNEGKVIVDGVEFDPNAAPSGSAEAASKTDLDAALAANKAEIKLTADVDYNAALSVPAGTTIDMNGKNLYVTGLSGDGTLTKNGGKLWANASTKVQITSEAQLADWSNFFAAYEALAGGDPRLDGIRVTANPLETHLTDAVSNAANRTVFMPNATALGAFGGYDGYQKPTPILPSGKEIDLNGSNLRIMAAAGTLGEGTITANGGTITTYVHSLSGENADAPMTNAIAITSANPTVCNRIYNTASTKFTMTADYSIPSGVTFGSNGGKVDGVIVYDVATEEDLSGTRINTGNAKATDLKLVNDLTLTADVDVGSKNVNYDNHTVTGGKIITTGTETNKPAAAETPELSETSKTLTTAGEQFTLTLSNATATGWSSDHTEVATVADGVVTAVANGNATITVEFAGGSLTCEVTVAIPETPTDGPTEVATKAALDTALTGSAEEIKLTADIDYDGVLTVPTGTTIDLNGKNLYVTGLTNNGTLTKNEGKLWANASTNAKLTKQPTIADVSNIWAANEVLLETDTLLDGIRLTEDLTTYDATTYATNNNATDREATLPNMLAEGAFVSGLYYATVRIPEGKTFDLNGHTLIMVAAANDLYTTNMGNGTIEANGGTIELRVHNQSNYKCAVSIAREYPGLISLICYNMSGSTSTLNTLGNSTSVTPWPVPSGVGLATKGGKITNVVFEVTSEDDFTREGMGNSKITVVAFKLMNNITLETKEFSDLPTIMYNGFTITEKDGTTVHDGT